MNWIAEFNLVGATLGMLAGTALLSRPGQGLAAWRLFGVLLIVAAVITAIMVLYATGQIVEFPLLIGVHTPMVFLVGPLFFLFCELQRDPARRLRWWDALHALPFIAYVVWLWPIYWLPSELKIRNVLGAFYSDSPRYQQVQLVHMTLGLLHIGSYVAVGISRLRGWAADAALRLPVAGIACIWLVMAVRFAFDSLGAWTTAESALVAPTAASILILVISFSAVRNRPLSGGTSRTYERSAMDRGQARQVAEELERLVIDERLFLDPEFSPRQLAERSGFSRHQVSQALNAGLGLRFSDFVNRLRVAEARRRIESAASRPNLTDLAAEVGFASRSSFYAAFRKHLGCAPGELRKRS